MKRQNDNDLHEVVRKRSLTPGERQRMKSRLTGQPAVREDLELEEALTRALNDLPDTQVSSNFTSRVLRAAEVEASRPMPVREGVIAWMRSFNWLQYVGVTSVMLVAAWFAWQQRIAAFHAEDALASAKIDLARAVLARDAATFHAMAPVPSIESLQDFETISRLGLTPGNVDLDLLASVDIFE